MSDLISRKAAIDEVMDMVNRHKSDKFGGELIHYTGVLAILNCLPSAQTEIIHCKDCELWEKQKDSLQGRCELMQMYPTGAWYCGNARRRVTDG